MNRPIYVPSFVRMPTSLDLELEAPHMRPEASPWESVSSVKTFASLSVQKSLTMVSLPAAVDLSQLLLPGEAGEERRLMTGQETLHVEIQGYDNGVTFSLGKASIPLPTMPVMMEQSSTSHHPMRVCLTGAEGVRTGTLVGAFRAYWSSADEPPRDVDPNLNIVLPQQQSEPGPAMIESQEKIAEYAIDQEAEHPTLGEHSGEVSTPQCVSSAKLSSAIVSTKSISVSCQCIPCFNASMPIYCIWPLATKFLPLPLALRLIPSRTIKSGKTKRLHYWMRPPGFWLPLGPPV